MPIKLDTRENPEAIVQKKIIRALEARDWYVRATFGNYRQSGFPDLYAVHGRFGPRWIEVKDPERSGKMSIFTPAQMEVFPQWTARHIGIWVLKGAEEEEISKLFKPANWFVYLI